MKPDFFKAFQAPDWHSPCGYDAYGFLLHVRILKGLEYSLTLGLSIAILSLILAVCIAYAISKMGPIKREFFLTFIDTIISIPSLLIVLFLASVVGMSKVTAVLWITLLICAIPFKIRFTYNLIQKLEKSSLLESAKALGYNHRRILWKYYFPNLKPYLIPLLSWSISSTILTEAVLSFLGLGDPLRNPSLGKLLIEGKWYMIEAPHLILFPTIALLLVIYFFNYLADSIKDS